MGSAFLIDTRGRFAKMMIQQPYQMGRGQKEMVKKGDVVRSLVEARQYKQALRIAKDFRLGITQAQSMKMKKAYECMVHERFYLSLGENIQARIDEGIETIISIYGREKDSHSKVIHKQIQ